MATYQSEKPHLPELDGIRGLAILGVMCSHGVGLSGLFDTPSLINGIFKYCMIPLWGGVDLFFALSGFLITGILIKTKSSERYFSSFYARRMLRIFPIYYVSLTVSLICGHFSSHLAHLLPPTFAWRFSYFLYLQNWPVFWHGQRMMSGIWGAYWSLAVEEQFYLVWPLLVFLLNPKWLLRVCVVGVLIALPLRILLSAYVFGDSFGLGQISSSRVDGLLLGAACAIYTHEMKRPVPLRYVYTALCIGLGFLLCVVVFHHRDLISTSRWILTIGISGFALLSGSLVALSQHHIMRIQRVLTFSPLRSLGKYSYGMYVYHLFVLIPIGSILSHRPSVTSSLNFVERCVLLLLEMLIVFLIAKVSYDQFEQRFLRYKVMFSVAGKSSEEEQSPIVAI